MPFLLPFSLLRLLVLIAEGAFVDLRVFKGIINECFKEGQARKDNKDLSKFVCSLFPSCNFLFGKDRRGC